MTMAWLVKWDENNNPYPELATEVPTKANGGVSKDGLTITYHLRKGVKWSDGAPFDADDVVFTTKVILNPATNEVGRLGWDQITKIDEPDKYTVVYHMKKPYSPFVTTFFSTAGANPCILPKHLLDKLPNINNAPVQRAAGRHRAIQVPELEARRPNRDGRGPNLLARPSETRQSDPEADRRP